MDKEALIKEYDLWLTKGYVSAIVIIIMVAVVLKTKVVVVQPRKPSLLHGCCGLGAGC